MISKTEILKYPEDIKQIGQPKNFLNWKMDSKVQEKWITELRRV